MKKIIIPATLLAMLSLTTVSCQKENLVETATQSVENNATRTIRYTVNGTAYRQVIHTDEDLDALMFTLFALVREGYTVRMMDENNTFSETSVKVTETYTTKIEKEAKTWAKEKMMDGYVVTITYNEQTGIYTCIATK